MDRLLDIMRRLRGEGGCPWDRQQTLASLKPYLIEEAYEVLDAIDEGSPEHLREELGDVLLQIVFQSQICAEAGQFTFQDVAATVADKLVRRHPHVFGDVRVENADEVLRNWDAIKRGEKGAETETPKSAVDGVPRHLPALLKADRVQTRAARIGFDWNETHEVVAKLDEEIVELKEALATGDRARMREELGDVLFTLVNLSRFIETDAETALHATTAKFIRRFQAVERKARERNLRLSECGLPALDALWDEAKAEERGGAPADS